MIARVADIMSNNPSHVSLLAGANDLYSYTAAAYYNKYVEFFDACRAIDRDVICIACGTLFLDESAPANAGKAGHNAKAATLHGLLRAGVGTDFDAYAPLGEHPLMTAAAMVAGGTYSVDGLHLNQPGAYGPISATFAAVMNPIKALATGAVPSAFTFVDQSNCEPGSTQNASAPVTGMGIGRSATGTHSGDGTFTRNQGAFGTSSFSFMNGDFALARLIASMTAEATVSETVTIGGVSETFSATTEAADPADFNATAPEQFFDGGFASGSTKTFSAVAHPGGVPFIAAAANGGRTFTSVTFNGVALTALTSMDNGTHRFFIGSAEVAAGNYDIVVTLNAAIGSLWVWPGGITGISSSTPVGVSKLASGFRFDGAHNASPAITLGTGAIGIIFGSTDADSTISGFGPSGSLVKDYGQPFFAKFTASGTPTFTTSGSSSGDTTTKLTAAGFG
jgi:hypothetical protein